MFSYDKVLTAHIKNRIFEHCFNMNLTYNIDLQGYRKLRFLEMAPIFCLPSFWVARSPSAAGSSLLASNSESQLELKLEHEEEEAVRGRAGLYVCMYIW